MSDEKIVRVEVSQDNAILLLDAAEKTGDGDVSVVRTTSFGWFEVPASVAKKAGVDIIPDEEEEVSDDVSFNPDPDAATAEATKAPAKKAAAKTAASPKGE